MISVRDDGEGLTPELRDRVFDLFVQGPDTRSMARGGLGLGLILVRQLVQVHGGEIAALSDGPGEGSEFLVRLPYVVATHGPSRGGPALDAIARERRILLVDDNVDAAEALADLLREYGHNVRTAHAAGAGIKTRPSGCDPRSFCSTSACPTPMVTRSRRLRAELSDTLIVALTGYGEQRHRERSREAGFDHHLTKPVDMRELERLLTRPT